MTLKPGELFKSSGMTLRVEYFIKTHRKHRRSGSPGGWEYEYAVRVDSADPDVIWPPASPVGTRFTYYEIVDLLGNKRGGYLTPLHSK